jgi:hypothetical protein
MVCFDRTKGWKEAGSLIVQGFFMPINYRGSAVEHPQISCHFSLPTIWGARNSVGRSAIPLVSVEYIFFCAHSMMRTYHETSHIVVSFPGFHIKYLAQAQMTVSEVLDIQRDLYFAMYPEAGSGAYVEWKKTDKERLAKTY